MVQLTNDGGATGVVELVRVPDALLTRVNRLHVLVVLLEAEDVPMMMCSVRSCVCVCVQVK